MTAPADRCKACDRAECDRREAQEAAYAPRTTDFIHPRLAARVTKAEDACFRAKVDWRARCVAAEAEALASRALLQDALDCMEKAWPSRPIVKVIREHLRGRL